MTASIQRNIDLYPIYRAAADAMAWLPVFFLYFSEQLTLSEVLLLEAIYYISVVIMEVPSGYFSDRIGRRRTLLVSCIALLTAYLCFLWFPEFAGFAVGQILIAVSIAFKSGTDTAFHYESLQALGRSKEYGDREALAGKYGFAATALAALSGGFLGNYNLAYPYWLSILTALISLCIVVLFTDIHTRNTTEATEGFLQQLATCVSTIKHPLLFWLFVYSVYMTTFVHIPFEFYQPYLRLLENNNALAGLSASATAGILFAATALVAATSAAYSMQWQRSLGLTKLLLAAAAIELVIIAAMAMLLHPLIALLVIARSGPMAVIAAPTNAAIAPLILNQHRATYLSLQSLAGRLMFAIVLYGFSQLVTSSENADWSSLSLLLRISIGAGAVGLVLLALSSRKLVTPRAT